MHAHKWRRRETLHKKGGSRAITYISDPLEGTGLSPRQTAEPHPAENSGKRDSQQQQEFIARAQGIRNPKVCTLGGTIIIVEELPCENVSVHLCLCVFIHTCMHANVHKRRHTCVFCCTSFSMHTPDHKPAHKHKRHMQYKTNTTIQERDTHQACSRSYFMRWSPTHGRPCLL